MRDLVSTVIPVRDRPVMLREAVESVLAQTWRPIEILICDDGSTDATVEVGRSLASEFPQVVRYQWNPNRGAGPAREAGRLLARGEFIQYLDSDDLLSPRKFEVQVAALRANPDCGIAYGQIRLRPDGAAPIDRPHKWTGRNLPTLFPWLLVDRWWSTNAPLWRRSVCDQIGPWSDLRYSQDWEYDARAGALGVRLVHCPEYVGEQRQHGEARQTGSGAWLAPPDRVRFFRALFDHARAAGVGVQAVEMRHFARWVFSQARQCALLDDAAAAERLCELAAAAQGRIGLELVVYRSVSRLIGWRRAAQLSEHGRRLLGRTTGPDTQRQSWMD